MSEENSYHREIETLWKAFNAEIGIEIKITGNFQKGLLRLYKAKKIEPEFEYLSFHRSLDHLDAIWICKKRPGEWTLPEEPSSADRARELSTPAEPLFDLSDIFNDLGEKKNGR